MAKMIFFDIDGTLWDRYMVIPESTKTAIAKLRENGHMTFLCSGRSRSSIQAEHLLALGFDGIVAACGNYIEINGEVVYDNLLPDETVKKLIATLSECRMPVVLEGPGECWIDTVGFEEDPYVDYLFELLGDKAHPLIGHEDNIVIEKCSADRFDYTDYDRVKALLGDEFDFIEHEGFDLNVIEMVPKGTSKATGIKWLCDKLNVPVEDTFAVGDSVNDLDMLKFVGHSVAMGNGADCVKAIVEHVTTDIHEDGIYKAMLHYGLI